MSALALRTGLTRPAARLVLGTEPAYALVPPARAANETGPLDFLVHPLSAFAILAWRYTRTNDFAVQVTIQDKIGAHPAINFTIPSPRLDEVTLGQFRHDLQTCLQPHANLSGQEIRLPESRITLAWRFTAGAVATGSKAQPFSATLDFEAGVLAQSLLAHPASLCLTIPDSLVNRHYRTLLDAVSTEADQILLRQLPMMEMAELDTILHQWSGSDALANLIRPELLHELFEAQADLHPERIALDCAGEILTYAELERRSNQLAWELRARGVGRGSCVGLFLPRSNQVLVGLLAILKAGAAYVPMDPEYPADRVAYILQDSQACALLTTSELAKQHQVANLTGLAVLPLDQMAGEFARQPEHRPTRSDTQTASHDPCYIIYTSGSTGRPKGVLIEHRSACHLVRAEGHLFQVQPEDRVYHGFSIAFDASVEEVWLAFHAGATLVVGTAEMVRSGPELPRHLAKAGVTVLSCVPTLLSMMQDDIPGLRLLILGGEQCPQDLVRRWHRPGRRMVNTYGPTEATVIATLADCLPDQPVTIGRAVPNYRLYILDEDLHPVPTGVAGELHIGGVGLARGYVGRPDLTGEKFIPDPFSPEDSSARLYKTGDLVRFDARGQIEFLGRIDTQVKIRGFRIELSEIESVLMQHPRVQGAVVSVYTDASRVQHLVGYLVPRGESPVDEGELKTFLRSRLPAYMVPTWLEILPDLPTLPSGKVDRKKLPAPQERKPAGRENKTLPATALESKIVRVWENLFKPEPVGVTDNFFLDLGGHSLLAAVMVSALRQDGDFHDLSMHDVYQFPTIRQLAAEIHNRRQARPEPEAKPKQERAFASATPAGYSACVTAQGLAMYLVAGFFSLQWLSPYLTYYWMLESGYGVLSAMVGALGILLVLYPAMLLSAVAIKWLVIGRYKPGRYPLWGSYYFRWWFVNQILGIVPIDFLAGTPLLCWYYRLLGAKIGANVFFGTDNVRTFDLIEVGDDASIGIETNLLGYSVEDGLLILAPTRIGRRCFVGTRSVLRLGSRMEDDSRLGDLSLLSEGIVIPAGASWVGSPARPSAAALGQRGVTRDPRVAAKGAQVNASNILRPSLQRRLAFGLLHAVGIFLLPTIYLSAIFPGLILMNYVSGTYGIFSAVLAAPLATLCFVVLMALEITTLKWLLLGRVQPGSYPIYSWFYVRKWFFDQLMDISLDLLGPLYATLYLAPWYRSLGAKLGRNAEISTACAACPDLLKIDDESFIADCVSLGAQHVDQGLITLRHTYIGKRAFIGNSAMIPSGTMIPDNTLVGVLSAPPLSAAGAIRPDTSWLGSPAIFLPQRQTSPGFAEDTTFKPARRLYVQRAVIEFFRILLPLTFFIMITTTLIDTVITLHTEGQWDLGRIILAFPVLYLAFGVLAALIVVSAKWILMGRYRPGEKPLWSPFVWKSELMNALHENLADPYLVSLLQGTPFVNWFFRLLGARIGKRVYMESTEITEFDLIHIGDEAMINNDCTLQTHLFEDRVMKMSEIHVGPRCSAGAASVILYDTRLEEGSSLSDLSLLMKSETLPSATRWEGTPARLVK